MFPPPDAPFNLSFLHDAFDYSRYPSLKAKDLPFSTINSPPNVSRPRRQQAFFASFNESSPRKESRHPRNVSEPQLISSTNYMRESWYTNFGSARTVGDIANLSTHEDISTTMKHSRSTVSAETLLNRKDDVQEPPPLLPRNSEDISRRIPSSEHEKGDADSLYSMDSADQEAHSFLLSMPIIPQIKLERKATVRKLEPGPALDDTQRSLLSPRIKSFRTPAKVTPRRYGHIGPGTNSQVVTDPPMARNNSTSDAPQRTGWNQDRETDTIRGFSAYSNSPETSDDEEKPLLGKDVVESPHADVLLSFIDEVDSSPSSEGNDSSLDETSLLMRVPPKRTQRRHRRSTATNHSLSFSNLVHAVADGCASLDTILRKPKPKPNTKQTTKTQVPIQNAPKPTSKWAPKDGQIIIKVFFPSTDDIWAFRVPEDIALADLTSRVVSKLGFAVSFSGSLWDEPRYHFRTDERFRAWVKRRVRFGRNLPIVAHVVAPLPLIKLSVDAADGCEIWCYA